MVDAAEYKHVVLGLIFLKYISDSFAERWARLEIEFGDPNSDDYIENEAQRNTLLENRDEYKAENVFWVPPEARWPSIARWKRTHTPCTPKV